MQYNEKTGVITTFNDNFQNNIINVQEIMIHFFGINKTKRQEYYGAVLNNRRNRKFIF